MDHPLDGARLKVVRAQEHLDALKAEIGMYMQSETHTFVSHKEPDVGGTLSVIHPPLRLSTLVGDVVVNARAALDYIIYELAVRYFKPPFDPFTAPRNVKTAVTFPIYTPPPENGYATGLHRLANLLKPAADGRDIPTLVCDEIKRTQTHAAVPERTHKGRLDTLSWLHHLVNTDKHRTPLLAIGRLRIGRLGAKSENIADVEIIVDGKPLASGTGITNMWLTIQDAQRVTITGGHMQMDVEPSTYVTLADATMPVIPVDFLLEQIIKTVANTLPRFDGLFP